MTQSTAPSAPGSPLPPPKERRRLRESRSLTEAQLAAVVGVTKATLRSWETGRTSPRGRKREMYARVLAAYEADLVTPPAPSSGAATPLPGAPAVADTARRGSADAAPAPEPDAPAAAAVRTPDAADPAASPDTTTPDAAANTDRPAPQPEPEPAPDADAAPPEAGAPAATKHPRRAAP